MKKIKELIAGLKYSLYGNTAYSETYAEDITASSDEAKENTLFFCIKGAKTDGHLYAEEAYGKGARIFFCERKLSLPNDAFIIVVNDCREAMALVSAEFYSHPEKKLKIIGVTGTKGKSSVCEMIRHTLERAGKKAASVGTLGIRIGDGYEETQNSTPESYVLYKAFHAMAEAGIEYAVMEVSSQAVMQKRIFGLRFRSAVFTNLSPDHIGEYEHPDFEHYKECKKAVFALCDTAFINADGDFAKEFIRACRGKTVTYGIDKRADVSASEISPQVFGESFGISFLCRDGRGEKEIRLCSPGKFSVYNALAAYAVCACEGVAPEKTAEALYSASIKGRFETVPTARKEVTFIIDYAHNAESLASALTAVREYCKGKVICVFGSVGGRTKNRRKEMGLCAGKLADLCIITSDNPDCEPADAIICEIAENIPHEKCVRITNREEAIRYAVNCAESGDTVMLAGKGHEDFQLINGKKLPFSERELLKKYAWEYVISQT